MLEVAQSDSAAAIDWLRSETYKAYERPESEVTGKKLTALSLPALSGELLVEKSKLVREGRSASETSYGSFLVSSGLSDGVGESTDGLTSVTGAPGLASTAKKSLVEAPR